jgi:hypothetical protein
MLKKCLSIVWCIALFSIGKPALIASDSFSDNPMGKTWVVFIENTNYHTFSSLEGPTRDVMSMMQSLSAYRIDEMVHKKNLSKTEMERFFAIELRDLINENQVNSLLIWYAGHGKYLNETGYWVPVDGNDADEFTYFSINSLRVSVESYLDYLTHVLIITDACESGPSFADVTSNNFKAKNCTDIAAVNSKSAQVLSSAGYELASDNSQFTRTFSGILESNRAPCISIESVAEKVSGVVEKTGNQSPKFGVIKGLSDQGGTFFFVR